MAHTRGSAVFGASVALVVAGGPARAATGTYEVGVGAYFADLTDAITAVNAMTIPVGSTLQLHASYTGSWAITSSVTIEPYPDEIVTLAAGPGIGDPYVDGIFGVDGATLIVSGVSMGGSSTYRLGRVVNGGTLALTDVDASSGQVVDGDGGCFLVDGPGTLAVTGGSVSFCNASGTARGGAVAVRAGGWFSAAGTDFVGSLADDDGGALWCEGTCQVTDSELFANATNNGRGGAVRYEAGADHLLHGSLLCANTASNATGGAVSVEAGSAPGVFDYNVFFGNAAQYGGAIHTSADLELVNNDFVDNRGLLGPASAISANGAGTLVTTWNGIYAHQTTFDVLEAANGAFVVVQSALFYDYTAVGAGVVTSNVVPGDPDPRFVAYTPGNCQTSDLHLVPDSPAIGAGNATYSLDLGAFPCGVPEVTGNGVDEDCDGFEVCWVDDDYDGFGDVAVALSADADCDDPGEAGVQGDCDTLDGLRHPGAAEIVGDEVDQDCDGSEDCWEDLDGDGFGEVDVVGSADADCADDDEGTAPGDCDLLDPLRYPGAPEIVGDDIDQDCDGKYDCWVDRDDDGYGGTDPVEVTDPACSGPGQSAIGGDCDDDDVATHPDADEVCDGLDQDCSGIADDGLEVGYADSDQDGYGDPGAPQCEPGGAPSAGDCDDGDEAVHPGAVDPCDGYDTDCDGALETDCGPETEGAAKVIGGACGCATGDPRAGALLALVAVVARRRRSPAASGPG